MEVPNHPMRPKRVFISYARKDSTRAEVEALVRWLSKQEGVEVISDHLFPLRAPPQGWYAWMQHSIEEADVVLCICGEVFKEGFEKRGGSPGVTFEGDIVTADLYEKRGWNEKFHPILPQAGAFQCVPKKLQPWSNDVVLSQRDKILALIREEHRKLPPPRRPPGGSDSPHLEEKQSSKRWKLLAPLSLLLAVLGIFVAVVVLSPREERLAKEEPQKEEKEKPEQKEEPPSLDEKKEEPPAEEQQKETPPPKSPALQQRKDTPPVVPKPRAQQSKGKNAVGKDHSTVVYELEIAHPLHIESAPSPRTVAALEQVFRQQISKMFPEQDSSVDVRRHFPPEAPCWEDGSCTMVFRAKRVLVSVIRTEPWIVMSARVLDADKVELRNIPLFVYAPDPKLPDDANFVNGFAELFNKLDLPRLLKSSSQ